MARQHAPRSYGPSPHRQAGGTRPGKAYRQEGSYQLGLAKGLLLARYDWSHFEPHPEWVDPAGSATNNERRLQQAFRSSADYLRLSSRICVGQDAPLCVCALGPTSTTVRSTGIRGTARATTWVSRGANEEGRWPIPLQPTMSDWVLVLEASADQAGSLPSTWATVNG